jgi:ribonuclease HI
MTPQSSVIIYTDGGSRGNPGPAAIGVSAIDENSQTLFEASKTIGIATNNIAEYQAFLESITWLDAFLKETQPLPHSITWKLDSKLVVEQLNKNWKLRDQNLAKIAQQIWKILDNITLPYQITHVPREQNKRADWLVNQALDHS